MEGGNVRRGTYEPSANVFVGFGEGPNLCTDYQINGGETLKRHKAKTVGDTTYIPGPLIMRNNFLVIRPGDYGPSRETRKAGEG